MVRGTFLWQIVAITASRSSQWKDSSSQQWAARAVNLSSLMSSWILLNCSNDIDLVDYNHRVRVLNSDLTFSSSFGKQGSGKGQFSNPWGIACDKTGKVYVVSKSSQLRGGS